MANLPQAILLPHFRTWRSRHLLFVGAASESNVTLHDSFHEAFSGALSFKGSTTQRMRCFKSPSQLYLSYSSALPTDRSGLWCVVAAMRVQ